MKKYKNLILVASFFLGASYNVLTFWVFGNDFERGKELGSVLVTAPLLGVIAVLIAMLLMRDV